MKQSWQIKRDKFQNELRIGTEYNIFNIGKLVISGVYIGCEKARYLFQNADGLFKVNIHKMKNPEAVKINK